MVPSERFTQPSLREDYSTLTREDYSTLREGCATNPFREDYSTLTREDYPTLSGEGCATLSGEGAQPSPKEGSTTLREGWPTLCEGWRLALSQEWHDLFHVRNGRFGRLARSLCRAHGSAGRARRLRPCRCARAAACGAATPRHPPRRLSAFAALTADASRPRCAVSRARRR